MRWRGASTSTTPAHEAAVAGDGSGPALVRVDWRAGPQEEFVIGVPAPTSAQTLADVEHLNAKLGWEKFRVVPVS